VTEWFSNAIVFFPGVWLGYYECCGRSWTEGGTRTPTMSGIVVAPKMTSSSSSPLVAVSAKSGINMAASSSSPLVVSTRSGIVVGGMVAASPTNCSFSLLSSTRFDVIFDVDTVGSHVVGTNVVGTFVVGKFVGFQVVGNQVVGVDVGTLEGA